MAPAYFNPDCDSATLLDYIRTRAVKDTESFAREADAAIRGKQDAVAGAEIKAPMSSVFDGRFLDARRGDAERIRERADAERIRERAEAVAARPR